MYYIVASQILLHGRARMQTKWKGKKYCLSFPEEAEKSYLLFYNVFSDVIFYLRVGAYYNSPGYREQSQPQHVLLL